MSSKFTSHSSKFGSGRDQVVGASSGIDQATDSGSRMDMVLVFGSKTEILAGSGSLLVSGLDFGSVAGVDSHGW